MFSKLFRKRSTCQASRNLRERSENRLTRRKSLRAELLEDRRLLAVYNLVGGVVDGEVGSLRHAIAQDVWSSEDDVINLAAGTYQLSLTGSDNSNAAGDLDLIGTKKITIVGAGAGQTIVDATGIGDRIFDIARGTLDISGVTLTGGATPTLEAGGAIRVGQDAELFLSDSTLTGNSSGNSGGGISSGGKTLSIVDSVITNNTATSSGGGVQASTFGTSTVLISNSDITDNTASSGGGLATGSPSGSGTIVIDQSRILDNTSTGSGGGGGGIQHGGNTLSITESEIRGNQTVGDGGGIRNSYGSVSLTDSIVSENEATGSSRDGGGISSNGEGQITLIRSSVINNSATGEGGGISLSGQSSINNVAVLTDSLIADNTALEPGGGVSLSQYARVETLNTTLSGNSANFGGGIYQGVFSESNIASTSIANNSASGGSGGGVFVGTSNTGNFEFVNSIIADNLGGSAPDDYFGPVMSQGHNLVGTLAGSWPLDATDLSNVSPLLGPLQDNGGPTKTHALMAGSPAIDAGNDTVAPAADQRGILRPQDGNANGVSQSDIGAYERVDVDNDGVSDEVEDNAPNSGDGNQDGIPDSSQLNVSSLPNSSDSQYVTLQTPIGTSIKNVAAFAPPATADAPEEVTFPTGFFDFEVDGINAGAATTVTFFLPPDSGINTWYKYGLEPGDTSGDEHWYEFLFDGTTGAVFNGNEVTLHFVDGLRGDNDLTENGIIVDPGAGGIAPNQLPVLTTDTEAVTAVVNNPSTNSGTFSDMEDGIAGLTLSATIGEVEDNGDGTWTWTHTPTEVLATTVTITAEDSEMESGSVTFDLNVMTPLTVTGTTPSLDGGVLAAGTTELTIYFSRDVDAGGGTTPFTLQSVGPDGLLGNADDVIVNITGATYSGDTVLLEFPAQDESVYRLTVADTLASAGGDAIDGNGDGETGGDFFADFVVNAPRTQIDLVSSGLEELAASTADGVS
ncbi:hypothetical protein N9N28_15780, partial [Rubripirellula amarantea]|nr:hypothetical protein [Rubripirellula amarantea]